LCGAISFCRVLDFGSNEKLHGSYFLHSINFDFGVFAVVGGRMVKNAEKHCIHGGILFYIGYTHLIQG
jgi:hypothetical protein